MADILVDDNFVSIFVSENGRIPIQISLKFVPKSPIDNKVAFAQVIDWHRTVHWRAYVALGGNELTQKFQNSSVKSLLWSVSYMFLINFSMDAIWLFDQNICFCVYPQLEICNGLSYFKVWNISQLYFCCIVCISYYIVKLWIGYQTWISNQLGSAKITHMEGKL